MTSEPISNNPNNVRLAAKKAAKAAPLAATTILPSAQGHEKTAADLEATGGTVAAPKAPAAAPQWKSGN